MEGPGTWDFSLEESSDDAEGWVQWFCDLEGHEFFIEVSHSPKVEEDYIRDTFNLYGLKQKVRNYK